MTIRRFWKSWLSGAAVLLLTLAAPALSQQDRGYPSVTVYASPT
jgi:hypothetical protein